MHRRVPQYNPAADSKLAEWKDATTAANLLDTGGGAIANGSTIGTFNTSGGTARAYTQWGALARPVWVTNVVSGLAGAHCNSSILATKTVTGFGAMTWQAGVVAAKWIATAGSGTLCDSMVDTLGTGQPTIAMLECSTFSSYFVGGRRIGTDTFTSYTGSAAPAMAITAWIIDYTNATLTVIESGVIGVRKLAFASAGTTSGAEPYALGIGGLPQQNGAAFGLGTGSELYFFESFRWTSVTAGPTIFTPDDLVAPETKMRLKYKVN